MTIKQVAARAEVSIGTVSNVLNATRVVAPETRARVEIAIADLGYVPHGAARALRGKTPATVGVIARDLADASSMRLVLALDRAAHEAGLVAVIGDSGGSPERERELLRVFTEQRHRAILLEPLPAAPRTNATPSAVLLVGLLGDRRPAAEWPAVVLDEAEEGRLIALHLRRHGRRRLCIVLDRSRDGLDAELLRGARETADECGDVVVDVIEVDGTGPGAARQAASRVALLEVLPDMAATSDDLIGAGLLHALRSSIGGAATAGVQVIQIGGTESALHAVGVRVLDLRLDEAAARGVALVTDPRVDPDVVGRIQPQQQSGLGSSLAVMPR